MLYSQVCKFSVGSYAYDILHLKFKPLDKNIKIEGKVLLDYTVSIQSLDDKDRIFLYEGTGSNYSIAGFQMVLTRHKLQYIIQYYVTSGLLVVVSWVK